MDGDGHALFRQQDNWAFVVLRYRDRRAGITFYLRRSHEMSKFLNIIALSLSALACLYSLMGIAMAYWVAAVPGNTPEHIRLNFLVWVSASVVTFALIVFFVFRLASQSSR